jgi:predicted signal transduction protein with EAL and GGDEF domain
MGGWQSTTSTSIKSVALRLSACVRDTDCVARLGGDEFGILQVGQPELPAPDVVSCAGRIVELISAPYAIRGHQIIIGASVGISVAPADSIDPDALLKNAEIALYRAKEEGRGAYRFFEAGMDTRAQARRQLELDMRAALMRNEFEVYYQPIYNIETLRIVCFEALVRWNHPLRGIVLPGQFIPLAEETGLIVSLGNWVLRRACQDAAHWSRELAVAVNLSPAQFGNRELVPSVMAALAEGGLSAKRLELEITESVFLKDSKTTLEILHRLRDLGIRISMDDFGNGYSSLSFLRSFPFDKIKIDASFVRELVSRDDAVAIVRAVAGLARSLGITSTAEGVSARPLTHRSARHDPTPRSRGCGPLPGSTVDRYNHPDGKARLPDNRGVRRIRTFDDSTADQGRPQAIGSARYKARTPENRSGTGAQGPKATRKGRRHPQGRQDAWARDWDGPAN